MASSERLERERAAYIQSLRDCATFLEQHPAVSLPVPGTTLNAFVFTREELAAQARLASWAKKWKGDWFCLVKDFGAVTLEINIERKAICRRVVTGTREILARTEEIVEWVCDETAVLNG